MCCLKEINCGNCYLLEPEEEAKARKNVNLEKFEDSGGAVVASRN